MKITKNRAAFFLILGAIAVFMFVFYVFFSEAEVFLKFFAAAFGATAAVYWCIYFHSITYELSENELTAKNGIFIKKTRKITLSDIVLEMRISIGKTVLATILRTSGGSLVVFGSAEGWL